jgi:TonB family protein
MILNWMVASAVFAALVYLAASLAERALAAAGKQRRGPWIVAIGVATAWPLIAGAWFYFSPAEQPMAIIRTQIGATAARVVSEQLTVASSWGPVVERGLLALWIIVSLALVLRIAAAIVRMRRMISEAEPVLMDGTPVLLSEHAGPAVCGIVNSQIVLPRWILELDSPLRSYVLRHESEHVAQRDAATVLGGALAIALVPWNPAVWVMSRRLRLVVELDCDARVLAKREPPERYGRLLMLVAQRQAHTRLQPMLAESSAHLERRITAMNTPRSRRPLLRAAILGTAAALTVTLAFSSPVMAGMAKPAPVRQGLRYANEVLQLPAAKTTVQAPRTPTYRLSVTRQGQGTTPKPPVVRREYVEFKIDHPAIQAPSSGQPRYPEILKQAGVEGNVTVQFIVNADSTIMEGSMKVLNSTHQLFTEAIRNALPQMRYIAAQVNGRNVRQLIEQQFEFRITQVEVTGAQEAVSPTSTATVYKPKTVTITGSVTVKKP